MLSQLQLNPFVSLPQTTPIFTSSITPYVTTPIYTTISTPIFEPETETQGGKPSDDFYASAFDTNEPLDDVDLPKSIGDDVFCNARSWSLFLIIKVFIL